MQQALFFIMLLTLGQSSITKFNATNQQSAEKVSDTTFVNLRAYDSSFVYEMKYAGNDNFLKSQVYDCAECYLRLKTVKALIAANKVAKAKGMTIKLFDCYRPLDVQKKMWEIVKNPRYVADPSKGSIHNRGGAVDITLVDSKGRNLDMGTEFDDFSKKAGHDYKGVSKKVRSNRKLLRAIMEANGFNALKSEWWHYNLNNSSSDRLSNFTWECD